MSEGTRQEQRDSPRQRVDHDLPGAPEGSTEAVPGAEDRAIAAEGGPATARRRGSLWADAWRELRSNPLFIAASVLIVVFTVMAIYPKAFLWFYPGETDPRACDLGLSLTRPGGDHWFGFDLQGCDYYANVIYGARVSIFIGTVTVAFAAIIAIVLGSVAAYYGGWFDTIIARIADIWLALPFILGGLVAITVFRNAGDEGGIAGVLGRIFDFIDGFLNISGFGVVAFVLVILGWPTMLRLMRSAVLEEQENDYVDAARALGASDLRIIARHIIPNAIAPVIVYATIYVGIVISAEAALSYLGVGLRLPAISWGLMINQAQARIQSAPHLLFFPGLFLSMTVFGFILMGDALRDALDPKLR